jgi:hypothetical protein
VADITYTPLTDLEIKVITKSLINWHGPALPRPEGEAGLDEVLDTLYSLLTRAQNLIQAQDGLNVEYTLQGITAPAERFLLGTEEQVQEAASLRSLVTFAEEMLRHLFPQPQHTNTMQSVFDGLRDNFTAPAKAVAGEFQEALGIASAGAALVETEADKEAEYSAFSLEHPEQFSMAWTTFWDGFRLGWPHVPRYSAAVTDPAEATRQFWPMIRSTALPYNLFVLRRLTPITAEIFRTNFGPAWQYDDLLAAGTLYGIDMTVFNGLGPDVISSNDTVRFTPSTMALLSMDAAKAITPIAVYVADPMDPQNAQTYTPASPAWIYSLMALKTSMTVHGIWLGHVYTLHIVTAAMQMATLNKLPETNIIYQLLAPQSEYAIPFDLLLLLGWSNLSPPTSISSAEKFLQLCNTFTAGHDFFSMDPANMLTRMNLDPADFTDPAIDDKPWNLYPNVQLMQRVWDFTAKYVGAVVDAGYTSDASVAGDPDLKAWMTEASGPGNVVGLPRLETTQQLKDVVTSVLYRITFHGMGRLRSIGAPEPPFASNYPPCLQKTTIPDPGAALPTSELLQYLPNTGTLGKLLTFYYIFAYNAPYKPVVPYKGAEDELFFENADANKALVEFRREIETFIKWYQPDFVQVGQWPRNIEL